MDPASSRATASCVSGRSSGWVMSENVRPSKLVGAVAQNVRELPVHVEEAAVERRDRDPDRGLVEDRPQPLLVLAQRLGRLLAAGDVGAGARHVQRRAAHRRRRPSPCRRSSGRSPSGQTTRNSMSKSDPSRAHRSQRAITPGRSSGCTAAMNASSDWVVRSGSSPNSRPRLPSHSTVLVWMFQRNVPVPAAVRAAVSRSWLSRSASFVRSSSSSARWRARRMLLAFCRATERSSCSSSSSRRHYARSERLRRERGAQHARADLRERRVAARRRVVAERRESAIVGRAQLLERNVLGRLEHPVPHFLGASRCAGRSARPRRRRSADPASCAGG